MKRMYKVYVKLNEDKCITSVNSEIFLSNEEMQAMKNIDEGEGDKYVHAQSQYLEKGLIDKYGRYNYKFTEGKIVEISEDEKSEIVQPEQQATAQDKIEAQVMYTALMTDTFLEGSEA